MQEGIISQKQYESSLEIVLKEKKRHGEVLISLGLLTEEKLNMFLTLQLKRGSEDIRLGRGRVQVFKRCESAAGHDGVSA